MRNRTLLKSKMATIKFLTRHKLNYKERYYMQIVVGIFKTKISEH